jgi:disulfide bond formation protein DsbB
MNLAQPITAGLAVLVLTGHILIVLLLFVLFFAVAGKNKLLLKLISRIAEAAMPLALTIALCAVLGSLFFSEIMHLEPCRLCWYQRILIYPQALLLGIAIIIKDSKIWRYIIPLASGGAVISLYHYIIQWFPSQSLICSPDSFESCSQILFRYYGYITIPLMAFTACFLILLLAFLALNIKKFK